MNRFGTCTHSSGACLSRETKTCLPRPTTSRRFAGPTGHTNIAHLTYFCIRCDNVAAKSSLETLGRLSLFLVLGFVVLVLALLAGRRFMPATAHPGAEPPPDRILYLTESRAPVQPEIMNYPGLQVVALGTVVQKLPARWTTPDWRVPAGFEGREERAYGTAQLAKPVVFHVKEYWKGPQATDVLIV